MRGGVLTLREKVSLTLLFLAAAIMGMVALANRAHSENQVASWYGSELEGSPTASGQPFRAAGLTAASKTYPLGTRLLVKHEGRGVSVVVNDRGPHVGGRSLDLSLGAAQVLGIEDEGVTAVEVSVVGESPVVGAEVLPDTSGGERMTLQARLSYSEFLAQKAQANEGDGFEPEWLPDWLFPFQRSLVDWSLRTGRGALFSDCGTGKTPMELVWAENVRRKTGKPVLIITPLAVSFQTVREAEKFGMDAEVSRDGNIPAGVTVTNYERLEHFDPHQFGGVALDESSAIKSFDGKRRALVTEFMRTLRYRLLGTATAAPNDYIELGTSSEALGYLGHMDMLGRFFVNAQNNSSHRVNHRKRFGHIEAGKQWRFKGHAEDKFWRWVASWARALRKPSDLGFDDTGFDLPPLSHRQHVVESRRPPKDRLFNLEAVGLREEREELRRTLTERCETAAAVLSDAESAVAWCHLNDEGKLLTKLIDGAVEIAGADSADEKERKLTAFSAGEIRVLVTKPSIAGWGLNWQHCHRMSFFPSHSYEQYYQAVRRSWRFGQKEPVLVDVVTTVGGADVLRNLQRKAVQADKMFDALVAHMQDGMTIRRDDSHNNDMEVPAWLAS